MYNIKKSYVFFDWIAMGIIMIVYCLAYTSVEYYNLMIRHAGIPMAVSLIIMFLNHINVIQAIKNKEKELILLICAGIIVVINMFLSDSGVGVLFDIFNLLLLLYLADKIDLDKRIYYCMSMIGFFILLLWIGKNGEGYNANTSTAIIFEMAGLSAVGIHMLCTRYKKEWIAKVYLLTVMLGYVLPFALKNNCRSITLGIGVLLFLYYLLPWKLFKNKKIFNLCLAALIGVGVAFPIICSKLWNVYGIKGPTILGSSFTGGRESVWNQFFSAFEKAPITGIGNDFLAKIPDLEHYNVHNAYLHILVVYGVILFVIFLYLLFKRLTSFELEYAVGLRRYAICFLITILCISVMETTFAVSFGNHIFFIFLLVVFESQERVFIKS